LEIIKKDVEPAGLQAIEFWSTICDEELILAEEAAEAAEYQETPARPSQFFIRGALKFLVPVLTEALTRQEDEPDEDTWNVAMASATCLSLVANTVGDEVVAVVVPFVQTNINSENWKFREAATIAFGAILEGPKTHISQLILQALPVLLQHLKDPVVYVKDTTAWTIGRICELHASTVTSVSNGLTTLLQHLVNAMTDSPRVVANVCWAIHNLALSYEDTESGATTNAMSPFFHAFGRKINDSFST
jgi:importin subunit beta-1